MQKGKYQKNTSGRIPVAVGIILGAILILLLILLVRGCGNPPPAGGTSPSTESTVEKNPDSIAIPGYEVLELQAGSRAQKLCLPNPLQNVCLFQISLYLEDGTLLWQSERIEPGTTSAPMVLTRELEKGTYPNAVLKYACFRLDGTTPLNGAETKLTLLVK